MFLILLCFQNKKESHNRSSHNSECEQDTSLSHESGLASSETSINRFVVEICLFTYYVYAFTFSKLLLACVLAVTRSNGVPITAQEGACLQRFRVLIQSSLCIILHGRYCTMKIPLFAAALMNEQPEICLRLLVLNFYFKVAFFLANGLPDR